MDDRYRIRGATEADLDRIGEIVRQAWEPIFGLHEENWGEELFDVLYANWPENIKASVGRHLAEHPEWAFVVESRETSEVAAFITYLLDMKKGIGIVGLNAVAAGLQGQGIGTTMYNFVMDRFRKAGLKQSVDKVALQARPSHCGRRQGARPSPILRFGEGAQRSISTARAGRSPDGLFQRAVKYAQVRTGLNDAQTGARKAYEKAGFNIERKEVIYYAYL